MCKVLKAARIHSPRQADLRAITPGRGDHLVPGKGTTCAAGSGGKSPGSRDLDSRGGKEVWAGSGRPGKEERGEALEVADHGLRKEVDSLL